jgi:hypothetical protein
MAGICDNLGTHRDGQCVDELTKGGIIGWWHMQGTTHWAQMHDGAPFAVLATLSMSLFNSDMAIAMLHGHVTPREGAQRMLAAHYTAEEKAMAPHVLDSAFKSRGISPWNPKLVKTLAELNHGTADCVEGLVQSGVLTKAIQAVAMMLRKEATPIKPIRARPMKNTAYTVPELQKQAAELEVEREAKAKAAADEKQAKAQAKIAKQQEKEKKAKADKKKKTDAVNLAQDKAFSKVNLFSYVVH